jgi:hypothetical protein
MNHPDISKFLTLLKNLEVSSREALDPEDPEIQEIIGLAETVLITSSGACNWAAHEVLRAHGYDVFCAERDSFGWLVGGIQTAKGVIYYG